MSEMLQKWQGEVQLLAQDIQHFQDAGFAADREAPEHSPANHDCPSACRDRLEHVGAAPDSAIEVNVQPITDGVDDLGECEDCGVRALQGVATVVADDHARDVVLKAAGGVLGGWDALDDNRESGAGGNPVDDIPSQPRLHRLNDEFLVIDTGAAQVAERSGVRRHAIGLPIEPQRGRPIPFGGTGGGFIDGDDQGRIARFFGALDQTLVSFRSLNT